MTSSYSLKVLKEASKPTTSKPPKWNAAQNLVMKTSLTAVNLPRPR